MDENIASQVAALKDASLLDLQNKYRELFCAEQTPCDNKAYLLKHIAYKLQEVKYGGLSSEAKCKIDELTEKYDPINNKTLRPQITSVGKEVKTLPFLRDKRLPVPGTVIHKKYKGQDVHIKVLEKGFEYKDKYYRSLTAIAFELTGAHWNGFSFFNL